VKQTDPFQEPAAWDVETARQWAEILDLRASNPDQMLLRRELLNAANLRPGDTAVEIGCGTGVLLAELAEAVGPTGSVVGVEPQPVFAEAARRRLAQRGLGGSAEVHNRDAQLLPLGDATADACVAQTVLVHIPDAAAVLAEMCRVVRRGGRVASIDQDGDTTVIDHPDRELTRRLVRFSSDHRFADGWTGRRLPRMFRAAGLTDMQVTVRTHVDTEPGSFLHGIALRLAESAMEAGAVGENEGSRWLAQLAELADAGSFFSSINYYLCVGARA